MHTMEIWYLPVILSLSSFALSMAVNTNPMNVTQSFTIFEERAESCESQNLLTCPSKNSFCCPKGSSCISTTNDNSTTICCPQGSDCKSIAPITCDIAQQDASKFPANSLHTTALSVKLPSCGPKCCPFGYSCQGNNQCVLTKQNPPPTSSFAPVSTSSNPAVEIPPNAPANDADAKSRDSAQQSNGSHFPPGAVVLGVAIGLLVSGLIGLAIWWLCRRRRQKKQQKDESQLKRQSSNFMGSTPRPWSGALYDHSKTPNTAVTENTVTNNSSHGGSNGVSEPMWAQQFGPPSHRTDFLLRRGDCETGLENNLKGETTPNPNSASTLERGRSKRAHAIPVKPSMMPPPSSHYTADDDNESGLEMRSAKSRKQTKQARKERLPPLFTTPLKFGLPSSPSPKNRPDNCVQKKTKPQRPPRSDENLSRLLSLSHKRSVEAANNVNEKDRANQRIAEASHHRDLGAARAGDVVGRRSISSTRKPLVAGSLGRKDSDASNVTILSEEEASPTLRHARLDAPKAHHHRDVNSSETINVMLPPPHVFRTPEPGKQHGHDRRDTTFSDMMRQAGWRQSEWGAPADPSAPPVPKVPGAQNRK